jgi:hypothetical protein
MKIIKKFNFKKYNSIGANELNAASKVIKSGKLSGFVADRSNDFFGGERVRSFERKILQSKIRNNS